MAKPAFNFKKADKDTVEAIKASVTKRGARNSGRTLAVMLTEYMTNLAESGDYAAIADADGNPLVLCREITDSTVYGWDWDSLPEEIRDKVDSRANNAASDAQRKSHRGWEGILTTLRSVTKDMGLSARIVPPSGETPDSAPFDKSTWKDTPTFGCLTFRPYIERKRGAKADTDDDAE